MLLRAFLAVFFTTVFATPVFAEDNAARPSALEHASIAQVDANSQQSLTKINLNTASAKELIKVKGLNASKARAIVSYRKKNGEFKSLEELTKVKGFKHIKTVQLKNIQDQLTLE